MKKKDILKIFIAMTLMISLVLPVYGQQTIYSNLNEMKNQINNDVQLLSEGNPAYYLVEPYTLGFDNILESNGQQYKVRIRSIQLEQANAGPVVIKEYLATAVPGYTATLSKTVSDSETNSIQVGTSATVSAGFNLFSEFKAAITSSYTNTTSHTVTYSVTEGQQFSFPSYYYDQGYTQVDFYMGFTYDQYKVTLDYIPLIGSSGLALVEDVIRTPIIEVRPPREGGGARVVGWKYHVTLETGETLDVNESEYNAKIHTIDGQKYWGEGTVVEGDMITEYVTLKEPRGTIISIPQ